MGIFSRFADIVNSNLNSLLEKAEDPEKMLRLIIQEMEDTLVEVRSSAARTLADKKELERRVTRLQQDASDWEEKAALALSKDREDLARAALNEKQKISESSDRLGSELEVVDDNLAKLKEELEQLQTKLKDAKARQHAMIIRSQTATSRLQVKQQLDSSKVSDTLNRFESYERRIDDLESKVDAYDLTETKTLADEFAELESEERINSELEALKARVKPKSVDTE
ncbi:phage shock protein PspA [Echinimonas agarilytica]|uniref:Phage shock protein PspA n=1 Tax=Echinimonas agarilytica TaxID=1215918 RepID=A0AA42B7R7_9GAMM|nr:phage shock protein PspA [Echinimonas agarilytica]MCM2680019.1 phage shock protein PspA [Echinimonas agarilytica]